MTVSSGLHAGEASGGSGLRAGGGGSGVLPSGGLAAFTDDFNRASIGSSWTNAQIVSNQCQNAADDDFLIYLELLAADQYVEADRMEDDTAGLIVRKTNTTATDRNAYYGRVSVSSWQIFKVVNGAFTTLVSTAGPNPAAGNRMRLEVVGSTLTLYEYVTGSPVVRATVTDGTDQFPNAGYAGLRTGEFSGGSTWDNFECGEL